MDSAINRLRQAHEQGIVVGLKEIADNQGGPQRRFDIDELIKWRPNTFNLFILAFQEIKNLDPANPHSFYQIAGIHGLPKLPWNNIQAAQAENDREVGYCIHGDVLFPSWHRPYLALLEQTLFLRMVDIAERFPPNSRTKYREAARQFRLPFWDYFRPRGRHSTYPTIRDEKNPNLFDFDFAVPTAITIEKLMIRTPEKDELTLVDNPLCFSYFPEEASAVRIQQNDWDETLQEEKAAYSRQRTHRHPTTASPDGDRIRLNKVANMRREDNNRYILNILLSDIYKSITAFATDADTTVDNTNDITSGSLEAMHNDYHGTIGGIGGHMASVPIAAFDPIFFLHHVNVDRYLAIWQASNPDAWFSDPQRPGEVDKETKGLAPFKTNKGGSIDGFWTAKGCRYTQTLGYVYEDADMGSPSSVRANFKKYYEWSRRLYGVNYQNCPFDIIDLKTTEFFNYGTVAGADYYSSQIPDCSGGNPSYYSQNKEDKAIFSREYYIDNKVSRLALNGAFTIFWFIEGDKTRINKTNPKDYVLLPTLAGLSHVFAAPVEGCANCEEQAEEDLIIRNTKPISSLLLDYVEVGQLASFDPEHVVPFLQERLDWRIVKITGELIDPATVSNFDVSVTVKATPLPRSENKAPVYLSYPQITKHIENAARIQKIRDDAEAEIRRIMNQLDRAENWAAVGEQSAKAKAEAARTPLSPGAAVPQVAAAGSGGGGGGGGPRTSGAVSNSAGGASKEDVARLVQWAENQKKLSREAEQVADDILKRFGNA